MKKNYFFEPHVGSAYHSGCGPYGKRILVLGSSFYCPYVYDDKACMECTDIKKKIPASMTHHVKYIDR